MVRWNGFVIFYPEEDVVFQRKPPLQRKSFAAFIFTYCTEVRSDMIEYAPHLNLYACSPLSTVSKVGSQGRVPFSYSLIIFFKYGDAHVFSRDCDGDTSMVLR